jgi:rubrerythrin
VQYYRNWPYISSNIKAPGPSGPGMMQPGITPEMMGPGLAQPGMQQEILQPQMPEEMMKPGMMQPGMQQEMMQPGMMQPGMMQPGMQQEMMKPGMMQPDMMCPGKMQPDMMKPGIMEQGLMSEMMKPGMQPGMQQGMMQQGLMPEMMDIMNQPQSVDMKEALELIKQAVEGETQDRMFYQYLLDNAPSLLDKELIGEIRDNEINHAKMFRQLYFELTGKTVKPKENITFEKPKTYCDGLRGALMGETNAVKKYRKIMAAMKNRKHINMMVEIITDELRHASLYNFLIHNNDCKF